MRKQTSAKSALLFSVACAALLFASPASTAQEPLYDRDRNASVMERARPDYEPGGIEVGAFVLSPTLEAGVEATDNHFASENNPESDVAGVFRASVEARSTWSRHGLRAAAGAVRTMHSEFPKSDVFDPSLEVEGRLDIGRTGEVRALARRYETSELWGSPDQPFNALSPVELHGGEVVLSGRYQFNRLRVSGQAIQRELDYDDAFSATGVNLDQDARDRTERIASVRGEFALSPDAALLVEARVNDQDYENERPGVVSRNSSGQSYTAGANFDLTNLVRGEVAVGYMTQDYKDPVVDEVSGLAANAQVEWFPSERVTVTGFAGRRIEETGITGARSFVLADGGVRVDYELRRNVIVSGTARVGQRDFEGLDREDTVWGLQAQAVYLVNRRVSVQAGYSFDTQSSEGAGRDRDYDINRGFVGLRVRL